MAAVVAVVALALILGLWPAPVFADELTGPPDAAGNYAVCNVDLKKVQLFDGYSATSGGTQGYDVRWRCNVGSAVSEVTALKVEFMGYGASVAPGDAGMRACSQNNGAGMLTYWRDDGSKRLAAGRCASVNESAASAPEQPVVDRVQVAVSGVLRPARLDQVTYTGSEPAYYPADYYPGGVAGGSPVLPHDVPPPNYACGATLRDMGGGQWFADLEAVNRDPALSSGIGADNSRRWDLSWDGSTSGTGDDGWRKVTVALPPLAEMPDGGWWARFHVYRDAAEGHVGAEDWTAAGGGDWASYDEDGPGPKAPRLWFIPEEAGREWFEEEIAKLRARNSQPIYLPRTAVGFDKVGGGDWDDAGGGDWDSFHGTCTVVLDPVHGVASAPAPMTVVPPTSGGAGPGGPGEADASGRAACQSSFANGVPVVGRIADSLGEAVCFLAELLKKLFIPEGPIDGVEALKVSVDGSVIGASRGLDAGVGRSWSALRGGMAEATCRGTVVSLPLPGSAVDFAPFDVCEGPQATLVPLVRKVLLVGLYLLVIYGVWRKVAGVFHAPSPGSVG